MRTVQIKTLELLIIERLKTSPPDHKIHTSFAFVKEHFLNEGYLYGVEHERIISAIYLGNFYKRKTAKALSHEFHTDTKTLLKYRKNYLRLFAKKYLGLTEPTNTDMFLLYSALTEKQAEAETAE